jgi:hypothetical protein
MHNNLLIVQTLCEKYAADYLQIFLLPATLLKPVFQTSVYDEVDKAHIHTFTKVSLPKERDGRNQGFGSFYGWAEFYNFKKAADNGHAGVEAHTKFAEELHNKYTNQGT